MSAKLKAAFGHVKEEPAKPPKEEPKKPEPTPTRRVEAVPNDVLDYAKQLQAGTHFHSIETIRTLRPRLENLTTAQVNAVAKELGYPTPGKTKAATIDNLIRNLEGLRQSKDRVHQIETGGGGKPNDVPPPVPAAKPRGQARTEARGEGHGRKQSSLHGSPISPVHRM